MIIKTTEAKCIVFMQRECLQKIETKFMVTFGDSNWFRIGFCYIGGISIGIIELEFTGCTRTGLVKCFKIEQCGTIRIIAGYLGLQAEVVRRFR